MELLHQLHATGDCDVEARKGSLVLVSHGFVVEVRVTESALVVRMPAGAGPDDSPMAELTVSQVRDLTAENLTHIRRALGHQR